MSNQKFTITQRMLNVHAFRWLEDFVQGTVMLETALDAIEIVLKSDYNYEEWMALTFCLVTHPNCWGDIRAEFVQKLGPGPYIVSFLFNLPWFNNFLSELLCPSEVPVMTDGQQLVTFGTHSPLTVARYLHLNSRPDLHNPAQVSAALDNQKLGPDDSPLSGAWFFMILLQPFNFFGQSCILSHPKSQLRREIIACVPQF